MGKAGEWVSGWVAKKVPPCALAARLEHESVHGSGQEWAYGMDVRLESAWGVQKAAQWGKRRASKLADV